jgi:hypothetical protein
MDITLNYVSFTDANSEGRNIMATRNALTAWVTILALVPMGLSPARPQEDANKAQKLVLRSGDIFEPGTSVNRVTSQPLGVCVKEVGTMNTDFVARGLSQDLKLEITNNSTEFCNSLGVSAYATYFGVAASLGTQFRKSNEQNSFEERSSFVVRVSVEGGVRTLKKIEPAPDVLELLALPGGTQRFARVCGDSFIYQVEEGGEFLAVVTHRLMDDVARNQLFSDLKAQYAGSNVWGRGICACR